jgi:glutaredoxin/glutathione-dependent peroxiredoxin
MTIAPGQKLPAASFLTKTADGVQKMTAEQLFAGRKAVLFAVPGAFTPTCNMNHLPGYVKHAAAIKAKGIDTIAVVAVNDVHVMDAWAKASGGAGQILFLADGNGEFAKAIGLDIDLSQAGMGLRSRRYSMILDDCAVKRINVEEKSGVNVSGAETILEQL